MNSVKFYRGPNQLVADVKPESGSLQQKQLMGTDEIRIQSTMSIYIEFRFADYCIVFGTKYNIQTVPVVKKLGHNSYQYTITAKAETLDIEKAQFLFLGADNLLREPDFSLMGTPNDFMALIVANINRIFSGWQVGTVSIPPQYKNLTFSKETCLSALARLAQEYETEFWIEGKTVSLGKLQTPRNITFRHGKGNGLYEINRIPKDTDPLITRLYAYGSEKNLAPGYRNFAKRLKMSNGIDFIENNTSKYGIVENSATFDDVFPRREGTVTGTAINDEFYFEDDDIDFDVNSFLLPGLSAKVTFNTGQLAGLTFGVSSFDAGNKAFTIQLNKDNSYIDLPNPSITMAPGDKYVITDIRMPESYIQAAEKELTDKAAELLLKLSEPQLAYTVLFDQKYFKQNNLSLSVGDLVTIQDTAMKIFKEIRVVSTTRDIVNESDIKVELADKVEYGILTKLQIQQDANTRAVASVSSTVQNGRQFNNQIIGNMRVLNGTLLVPNMPTTDNTLNKFPVYWDEAKGVLRAYKP